MEKTPVSKPRLELPSPKGTPSGKTLTIGENTGLIRKSTFGAYLDQSPQSI